MVARGHTRGHSIVYDEGADIWRYEDTGEPTAAYGGVERRCIVCGEIPINGKDPCLRSLPDSVKSACCGHGVTKGYIVWRTPEERE